MKKTFPNPRTLLIFTGGPGSGKSGTANRFLRYLDNREIVKVSYDEIKEKEWDIFGFDNEQQKDRINWWSLEEFYLTIQKRMWENKTILIEYPFYQRHKPKLQELLDQSGYAAATIYLYADMHVLYERGSRRDDRENRHPGHLLHSYHKETYTPDMLRSVERIAPTYDEFVAGIAHKIYNVDLGVDIPIDVTDFRNVRYEDIYRTIVEAQKAEQERAKG